MEPIRGLHHITAVAGDPQTNADFYQQVLGQRLVKTTVNFDDPTTYHLYYGDLSGTPGTILTFFPWAHVRRGVAGNGEAAAVAYRIPAGSIGYWRDRLARFRLPAGEIQTRFGADVIPFQDPDGMTIELVADGEAGGTRHWEGGPIPAAHAMGGFHGTTLWLDAIDGAAELLTGPMGYRLIGREGNRTRYAAAEGQVGATVDLVQRPAAARGRFGAGSIHHVAFRVPGDTEQLEYLARLRQGGFGVTPVQDRQYFRSIYFRIPGGVLFEIATDPPGFAYDEDIEALGSGLRLPPWLEPRRSEIEQQLPPLRRTVEVAS
jgi:glyoxalase family protein